MTPLSGACFSHGANFTYCVSTWHAIIWFDVAAGQIGRGTHHQSTACKLSSWHASLWLCGRRLVSACIQRSTIQLYATHGQTVRFLGAPPTTVSTSWHFIDHVFHKFVKIAPLRHVAYCSKMRKGMAGKRLCIVACELNYCTMARPHVCHSDGIISLVLD